MPYGKPNPLTLLAPKAPSVLIRGNRYLLLFAGIIYGYKRNQYLNKNEVDLVKERNITFDYIEAKKYQYYIKKTFFDERALWIIAFGDTPQPETHRDYYVNK